jgi:succinyl-CoA synthetase beta subunit
MPRKTDTIQAAQDLGRTSLDEFSAKALLEEFGISVPRGCFVRDAGDDLRALDALEPPWAVKIIAPEVQHKSDSGYVALSITDAADVLAEIERMAATANKNGTEVEGFLVEEMVPSGIEVIVGGFIDPCFGPAMMFGLGGIFVEVLKDVAFRVCPVTLLDAEEMIDELAGRPVLDGARGGVRADRHTLNELILAFGGENGVMMSLHNRVTEIELNPVIVRGQSAVAVDAVMMLKEQRLQT